MSVPKYRRPNMTDGTYGTGTNYKASIDGGFEIMERLGIAFLPQAQDTPNMTVRVLAGALLVDGTLTEIAAQNTGTITAPVTHPRIDRVVIDAATGAVSVVTGTENASPTAPAIPSGKLPVCRVALATSTTQITASLLTDERAPATRSVASAAEMTAGTDDKKIVTPKELTEWAAATATLDKGADYVLIWDATDQKLKRVLASSLGAGNYFGTGADGAVTTSGNVNWATTTGVDDTGIVLKNLTGLTINSGHTVTAANRARAALIYVKGNAVFNGTLSMKGKGSASLAAADITLNRLVADGVLTTETAQKIYSIVQAGGTKGAAVSSSAGGNGATKSKGTGGGAAGGSTANGGGLGGDGSDGDAFSGGAGGGGGGGAGGGSTGGNASNKTGGTGRNDGGGSLGGDGAGSQNTGVGGSIILIVDGDVTIGATGLIEADGTPGGNASGSNMSGGGGSGAGRIIILYTGTYTNSGTVRANGGAAGTATGTFGRTGGVGGAGDITIEKIAI